MLKTILSRHIALLACSLALPLSAAPAFAQDVQDEEEYEDDAADIVVVTAVRQGGAQDIKHFRSTAISSTTLPRPESLTVEGLMGEHDLTLPANRKCDQLFCLTGHAMIASLPARPDDVLFVGLGFDSNIDAASWRREPLSLMAVVDRSGSMTGAPIARVKAALHQLVDELNDNDRLGIAIYGTNSLVHLAPTDVSGNKQAMHAAIDAIQIDGSTNMEAGLKLGYDAAFSEAESFKGKVRMMVFTDEQPNTGRTDAASFMGMASDASRRGIGLTTIGVGVQYDGALATKIASVRGGNLFFLMSENDAQTLFKKEFRNMVSEVAHDITLTMTPREGYSISGVFGVPDGAMQQGRDGSITVTVPTAFLSSNGGGIFASVGKSSDRKYLPAETVAEGSTLMDVSFSYVDALDGKQGFDRLAVTAEKAPPENLRRAHLLVDQYLAMNAATQAYHQRGDSRAAFALLDGLQTRVGNSGLSGFDDERALIGTMREKAAFLAGYSGEVSSDLRAQMKPSQVIGTWRVISHSGVDDLSRGDMVEFTTDGDFITRFKRPRRGDDEMYQGYEINEHEIYIRSGQLLVNYRIDGNTLRMRTMDRSVDIVLRREPEEADPVS